MPSLNPLKKIQKFHPQKVIDQTIFEHSNKSKKIHFLSTFQRFQRIWNKHQFGCFYINWIFEEQKFWGNFSIFANFEVKPRQNGSKIKKTFFIKGS